MARSASPPPVTRMLPHFQGAHPLMHMRPSSSARRYCASSHTLALNPRAEGGRQIASRTQPQARYGTALRGQRLGRSTYTDRLSPMRRHPSPTEPALESKNRNSSCSGRPFAGADQCLHARSAIGHEMRRGVAASARLDRHNARLRRSRNMSGSGRRPGFSGTLKATPSARSRAATQAPELWIES